MKSSHLVYNVYEVCNNFVFSMLHNDNFTVHNLIEAYFGHMTMSMMYVARLYSSVLFDLHRYVM